MAAHILGYKGHAACPNASEQAVADAKLVQEKARLKKQADKDGESTPSASTSGKCSRSEPRTAAATEPIRPQKKQRNGTFVVISAKDSEYEPGEEAAIRKQAA
jgi:hypothetical protein